MFRYVKFILNFFFRMGQAVQDDVRRLFTSAVDRYSFVFSSQLSC